MRKVLAAFLLVCVGIMISASATPVRICLLEFWVETAREDSKCCSDCSRETETSDPCCHDLEELPDSPVPQDPFELPPAVMADLPPAVFVAPAVNRVRGESVHTSGPIRGPTSPAAHRAVLGIWRL